MNKNTCFSSVSRRALNWHASLSRLRVTAILSTLALGASFAPLAEAQTSLFWDVDGDGSTATGGTGLWDTANPFWRLGSATGALQTYTPNSDPSTVTANFAGTAGTVTIASGASIFANTLTFGTSGYIIASASGGSLTLSGTTPTINGNGTTTFTTKINGTAGFTLANGGFNVFAGDLTGLTGTINVNARATLQGYAYGGSGVAAAVLTGSQNQTWNVTNVLTSNNQGAGATIQLGAITGAGTISAGNNGSGATATGTDIFQVGALNTDTTFAGTFLDFAPALTGLTKVGTGNLTLTNRSTNTGGTIVNGGTLTLGVGGGTGAVRGVVTVNTGGTLSLAANNALGFATDGTQITTLNVIGGTVNIAANATGDNGFTTNFNLTGGTMSTSAPTTGNSAGYHISNGYSFTSNSSPTTSLISAPIYLRSGTINFNVATGSVPNNGSDLSISGQIRDNGAFNKMGTGYLNLSGLNTFTGAVTVANGTLNVGGAGDGTNSALGLATNGKAITVSAGATLSGTINNWFGNGAAANLPVITLNGGTLSTNRYTAIGALNLNGATVSSLGTQDAGNYQAFAFRGNVTVAGSSASTISSAPGTVTATTGGYHLGTNTTFTVASTGSATADLAVTAPLINQPGDFNNLPGALTKAGVGKMSLNATNTYTGATTVNAGTLLVNGSTASASAVTVNNTGTVLGGTNGTISGATTINAGSIITAADAGTVGALTLASTVTLNGGTFAVDIVGATADRLTIAGALTLTSANITFNGTPTAPSYVLATFASATGNFSGTAPSGYAFQFNNPNNPTELDLVAVPEPATVLAGILLVGMMGFSQRRKISAVFAVARRC